MFWGNSKHTLDLIQEKEARLCSLKDKSSMAIQLVQQTVSDLDTVNQEIAETVDEINEYISRLADTRDGLDVTRNRNQKIMQNFEKLLCVDD